MSSPHLLITGYNGTVGSAVRETAAARGMAVTGWDRHATPPDDDAAGVRLLDAVRPDAVLHLAVPSAGTGRANEGWLVNVHWTGRLAHLCRERGMRFLYASTVMVFTDKARGPFGLDTPPDATEGYGGEKRQGELAALAANTDAVIARLGWQIGRAPGGNNMLTYLDQQMREHGAIRVSRGFLPATSFVHDTAECLLGLLAPGHRGIYQLDSNDGWNLHQIVTALNRRHGETWNVIATDDFTQNQRMLDNRPGMPALSKTLPELTAM